ncbi:MAG: hypothetical protein E3K37_03695 [Candidatus Kuenenia sp.]|nr:hypothetical protein [Candidatus Kuenenia hertensis]
MINNVSPSASELLKQIQRLSSQTKPKMETRPVYKSNEVNTHTENIKKILTNIKTKTSDKTQRENKVTVQKTDETKMNNRGKNLHVAESYKPIQLEKIPISRQLGSFLDTYF